MDVKTLVFLPWAFSWPIPANGQRKPARAVCAPAASRSATAIGSRTATSARVSSRTGNSRSLAGIPISSARYRTGPTSASARLRWASILAFSICRLANACASRWRSATMSARSHRFWSAIVIAPTGRPSPGRFLDGPVNLGDAPIEIGDGLALDGEASLGVGGSVRKHQIDDRHMIKVGAREEAEHADSVQAHQHADHRDEDQAQERRSRVPMLGQPRRCDELPGFQPSAHDDAGLERADEDCGEASQEFVHDFHIAFADGDIEPFECDLVSDSILRFIAAQESTPCPRAMMSCTSCSFRASGSGEAGRNAPTRSVASACPPSNHATDAWRASAGAPDLVGGGSGSTENRVMAHHAAQPADRGECIGIRRLLLKRPLHGRKRFVSGSDTYRAGGRIPFRGHNPPCRRDTDANPRLS